MKYPKMQWGTMEAVINKLGGEDGVVKFLNGSTEIVFLDVDFTKPIGDLVGNCGFDKVNSKLVDATWVQDDSVETLVHHDAVIEGVQARVFSIGDTVPNSDPIVAKIRAEGFRPAMIEELLAFSVARPNILKDGQTLVALGSWAKNIHPEQPEVTYTSAICQKGSTRILAMPWWRGGYAGWDENTDMFLGVRE